MENILYLLLWAGAFFLMMRFGCGTHVTGHRHKHESGQDGNAPGLRWIAPETDTDPVCGMTVQTRNAKSAVHDGRVFYFCSRDCRERFEAAPESYPAIQPPKSNGKGGFPWLTRILRLQVAKPESRSR